MDKEEQILRRRLLDLANTAYQRGIHLFSDFLNLNEQTIFMSMKSELPRMKYFSYGGFIDAERKILCFCGNEDLAEEDMIDYPIDCIKITPINQKFSDTLSHRDFLGALVHLGIDRSKLGDILIIENEGYVLCSKSIAPFIVDNLFKIKHTMISCELISIDSFEYTPKVKEITGTISSIRLDSILSVAFNRSRSSLTGLIEGGKVFVNSKEVTSNSYLLKDNDVVSVRGMGKFKFLGTSYQTKKGRLSVKIHLYI